MGWMDLSLCILEAARRTPNGVAIGQGLVYFGVGKVHRLLTRATEVEDWLSCSEILPDRRAMTLANIGKATCRKPDGVRCCGDFILRPLLPVRLNYFLEF